MGKGGKPAIMPFSRLFIPSERVPKGPATPLSQRRALFRVWPPRQSATLARGLASGYLSILMDQAPAIPDPPELQRVTTQYVINEDRIRLSGETAKGDTLVLWLTQRMLGVLIPRLVGWLEQQGGDALLQEFAQQAAEAALGAEPPVAAQTHGGCVTSIDIATGPDGVVLVFKPEGDEQGARLALTTDALRQWLAIVRSQYLIGEWPTAVWPAWMDETQLAPPQAGGFALH